MNGALPPPCINLGEGGFEPSYISSCPVSRAEYVRLIELPFNRVCTLCATVMH